MAGMRSFRLDPRARFLDWVPITPADVLFSFELTKAKGIPQQQTALELVAGADVAWPTECAQNTAWGQGTLTSNFG